MSAIIWHDVEYRDYDFDLPHWLGLARQAGEGATVVEIGAATGRVSLLLAASGFRVIAVDLDDELLAELRRRARTRGLLLDTICQDARELVLPRAVPLILVPCSTVQMLGPRPDRARFFERAAHWLEPSGTLAVALHMGGDQPWSGDTHPEELPEPDVLEQDGHRYVSQTAGLRRVGERMELLSDRSVDGGAPERHADPTWGLSVGMLAREAAPHGLRMVGYEQWLQGPYDDSAFVELRR